MKKEIEELLREAYNSREVCQNWKDKIKAVAPELVDNKSEEGKWYKSNIHSSLLIYITEYDSNGNALGYGLDFNGDWTYRVEPNEGKIIYNAHYCRSLTPATKQEIIYILTREAEKRGFKVGAETEHGVIKDNHKIEINPLGFYYHNIRAIDDKGKWARIITQPETIEERLYRLEQLIKSKL